MGRIFNTTSSGTPTVAGRINRTKAPQAPQPQPKAETKKPGLLQKAADVSERFLLRPWAGNAANLLIHAGQNIGEGVAAATDKTVKKYANVPGVLGASGQTRVRDVASEAGKAALDLSTLATGGSSTSVVGAARSAPTLLKSFVAGGKAALPYGLAQGATEALSSDNPLISLDSAGKILSGGATSFVAGGVLSVGGNALSSAITKKIGRINNGVTDAAATASTYVPAPVKKTPVKSGAFQDALGTKRSAVEQIRAQADPIKGSGFTPADYKQMTGRNIVNPNGTLDSVVDPSTGQSFAQHRIDDIAQNLDRQKPGLGLGDKLKASVNPKTVTSKELADKAVALYEGGSIPTPKSPLLTEARNTGDLFHGTSKQAEQSIRNTGFVTKDGRVFFSTERDVAGKLYSQGIDAGWAPGTGQDVGGLVSLRRSDFNLLDATSAKAKSLRKSAGLSVDIPEASNQKFRDLLQQNGYDGISYPAGGKNLDVEISNLDKLNKITKSQSTSAPGQYFHTTEKTNVPSILEKNITPSDGAYGRGVYLTKTEERAIKFGDNIVGNKEKAIVKMVSDAKLKEIPVDTTDYKNWLDWVNKYLESKGTKNVDVQELYPTLQREIQKEGFDGIYIPKSDYALIYDPKKVSQLTSIWEEAQKVSKINAGGKTTAKQNEQLQTVIKNLRKGENAAPIKERGFVSTVKQSKNTPQGVKDIIKGSYVPKSNDSLANDARLLISSDPQTAELLALNPRNAVDVEVGNQLMSHYSAVGNHQKVAQIGEAMATSGTELGQAVQAFSNYDRTTPQGAIRFAQSQIKAHNALGKNIVKISDEQVKHIYDAAAAIQELPMGRERNIASQQLIDEVNSIIPSTVADKAITVWKAGLLTSLRTTERNLVSNTVMAGAERAKDYPAALADIVMSKKTGQRTLTSTSQGTGQGLKKGWQSAIDIVRTGYDPEEAISKYDVKNVTWGKNPVEQSLKKYTDIVFRSLNAQDKPFYNAAYARSLYDQAGAEAINAGKRGNKAFIENLVKNPTEHMVTNATSDASVATFKDRNTVSKVANAVKREMGKSEATKVLGEVLAPFTGVPSSVLGKFVDYSPIGFANGVRHAGQVMAGKVPELQRKAAQEIGRGVIGSGLFGIGAYLAKKGLLTGQPKDTKEARQWELEGKKANSVLVNGRWFSLQSVGPQTLILLAGGKAQQELGKNGGGAATLLSSAGKDFLGQSFLAGVQGPLNAITDPVRYGQSYIKSQATSVIPNIVKDTSKAFDPLQRETNSVTDAFKSGLPGARNTLLPKRDVLGNTLSNDASGAGAFVDLFSSQKQKTSPIISELSRLNSVGQNATPSKITPNLSTGTGKHKVQIKLTPKELNDLESNISSELQNKLNREVTSQHYKNMSDEDKAKKISSIVEDIRSKYKKQQVRKTKNQQSSATPLLNKILGIKSVNAAPLPVAKTKEQQLANHIATLEGYKKTGTLADRQNNPGNLRFVGQAGATKGSNGFAKFKTPQAGFDALIKQIRLDASRNLTLRQFVYKYAPPTSNNTKAYLQSIVKTLGISPDAKLKQAIK